MDGENTDGDEISMSSTCKIPDENDLDHSGQQDVSSGDAADDADSGS